MMPSPRDDLELRGEICAQRTCFEEQERVLMALRVSGLSLWSQTSGWRGERKGKRSWNLRQRGCWVLPVLAWRSHRGGFHSRWRRPGHYHLCPTPWWERCLFQFESGPLEERERERERAPRFMSKRSENFPLNTFAPALTWCWCIWPNYGILIFLVCFN